MIDVPELEDRLRRTYTAIADSVPEPAPDAHWSADDPLRLVAAEHDNPSGASPGGRRLLLIGATAIVVLATIVGGVLALQHPGQLDVASTGPDSQEAAVDKSDPLSTTPDDTATDVLLGQIAAGWVPYAAPYVTENFREPTGTIGWVTAGEPSADERRPVYSEPNGAVIGYAYRNLGYVPLEDVEGFDPAAARRDIHGCDTLNDEDCAPGASDPER